MQIAVVIPTRFRLKKLIRTLGSIRCTVCPLRIIVVCDGDPDTAEKLSRMEHNYPTDVVYTGRHIGPVQAKNYAIVSYVAAGESVLYTADDVEFEYEAINNAARALKRRDRKKEDAVIGFRQTVEHSPAGTALVGSGFLDRYPDRTLFYPGYYHYSSHEVHRLSSSLNKFVYCRRAVLTHFHPVFYNCMDQTHKDARAWKDMDHKIKAMRGKREIIWGSRDCLKQLG